MTDRRAFMQRLCLAVAGFAVPSLAGQNASYAGDGDNDADDHRPGKGVVGDGDNDADDRDDGPERARAEVAAGRATPLRKLLEIVEHRYPGEVVGVKLRARGDSLVYRIKILEGGGRLVTVSIDAVTRRIVSPGGL